MLDDFPEWELGHRAILSKGICGVEKVGGELEKESPTAASPSWRSHGAGLAATDASRDCRTAGPTHAGVSVVRTVVYAPAPPRPRSITKAPRRLQIHVPGRMVATVDYVLTMVR